MKPFNRRTALKTAAAGASLAGLQTIAHGQNNAEADNKVGHLDQTHDRVWLGGDFWANPMEDWRVVNGAAECQTGGGNRNVHLITRQLTNSGGSLAMSVRVNRVDTGKVDGGAGFRVGVRSDINDHRSNCFAGGGIRAGVIGGNLVLGNAKDESDTLLKVDELVLDLSGKPAGGKYALKLTAKTIEGKVLATLENSVPPDAVLGNVAVVSNYDPAIKKGQGARYAFANWTTSGDAFTVHPERMFGPILWSMYSLSDSHSDDGFVMKITALTGPLGEKDNKQVELQIKEKNSWKSLGEAELDPDAWTATFRVTNWNEKIRTPYRLVYRESLRDGTVSESEWTGIIRENPSGRPLRLGALTCQNDYAFPYAPVAENLVKLDPDMLYFSGDQLYENHGGYGIIREPAEPAILNYLRKFYQHGWSFREPMRDRPTFCIPDDHDVFQGNIWGESGKAMKAGSTSSEGGYREPARMVNVVHRTNTSHHPDPYDPQPVKQGISVYYGDFVYGGVGFAILADRQFKSGPEHVNTGGGRADHVSDPNFDTQKLDVEGLQLLGERQEAFLKHWVDDWTGHSIKVLLSQTVFAGVATHHGGYNGYLRADLDSGSWPQTPRNRAIKIIREGMPLHINGDQHLTTLVQYGVDKQRDGNWSFCTPAIAAGYPRWWRPDDVGMSHTNRPKHGLANTGEFVDGFGNKAYVYAVGNPEVGTKRNRYERAHQKGSGFGLVVIDPEAKTYTIHSYRFLIDATTNDPANEFPGWPVTIQQKENRGENVLG